MYAVPTTPKWGMCCTDALLRVYVAPIYHPHPRPFPHDIGEGSSTEFIQFPLSIGWGGGWGWGSINLFGF